MQFLGEHLLINIYFLGRFSLYYKFSTLLYSTVQYSTVLYCTVLYCTVLYCTVLYCPVLYCTVLPCTVLYCTVLHCTALYCHKAAIADLCVLYCTVLYCSVQEASLRETLSSNVTRILEGLLKEGTRCFYNYVISRRKRIAERRGGGYESKKHTLPIVPIV